MNIRYKYQLEFLRDLVRQLNFDSIYILIDKVDETEKTGNDYSKTYRLLQPLMKDLELPGLEGFGFKFFVWNEILACFREDARPDRVSQFEISWTRKQLESVLFKRLKAFSNNNIELIPHGNELLCRECNRSLL